MYGSFELKSTVKKEGSSATNTRSRCNGCQSDVRRKKEEGRRKKEENQGFQKFFAILNLKSQIV
ncbi:MAG: hypothetical protein ICV80_10530 [Microcoleus sp. T1-bin1]|nr:hypothetical protein [Microcoleus sp. T1-bin1]